MAQVLRVQNAGIRNAIEAFTLAQCFPDIIVFVRDGNGEWVTDLRTLENITFNRPGNKGQVVDRLTSFGDEIEFVPTDGINDRTKDRG